MADQCIVCLDNLETESSGTPQLPAVDAPPEPVVAAIEASKANGTSTTSTTNLDHPNHENHDPVALIQICGHVLHDSCLREWTEKANSCPICRQAFHLVHVYDKIGGTLLSSYKVEDKKQVAEFDPQAWLDENPEVEEEVTPCPICQRADDEEVLLLCDGCDTPYHTFCVGLEAVPRGSWFCMECVDALGPEVLSAAPASAVRANSGNRSRRSAFFPRTQASMRRARQRARSDEWQGAWGQIAGRIWDALSIDLDYHDEDDDALEDYRRSQQQRERERQEHERWQQRLNIASRLGARDVFANSFQNVFPRGRSPPPRVPPPEQTREEKGAWRALEKARENDDGGSSASRKRKSRSATASPGEPRQEPERKLKRPRTRRLPIQNGEASSSKSAAETAVQQGEEAGSSISNALSPPPTNPTAPSFLSSLLKEVEMSTPSDDENIRNLFGHIPGANDASSPAPSPSASGYSSPRASSITPPPHRAAGRPTSPTLSLSSHIEPIYPPAAKFSPTRASPENSDSESGSNTRNGHSESGSNIRNGHSELRQPRPRRSQPLRLPRSPDVSPTRAALPLETKQNINDIVRDALRPHWKSSQLTAIQYATINRDVSHKLYKEVTDPSTIDEEAKKNWEKVATQEVARAVSDLKA